MDCPLFERELAIEMEDRAKQNDDLTLELIHFLAIPIS